MTPDQLSASTRKSASAAPVSGEQEGTGDGARRPVPGEISADERTTAKDPTPPAVHVPERSEASPSPGPSRADAETRPAPHRRRTVLVFLSIIVLFFGGWFLFEQFVAYTDDAIVTSDVVAIAPEISGPIVNVHVKDTQVVSAGDLLVSIDPKPFEILRDQARASLEENKAQLEVDRAQLEAAKAGLQAAEAKKEYADHELERATTLAHAKVIDQHTLDQNTAEQREAAAQVAAAKASVLQLQGTSHLHETTVAAGEIGLNLAQWRLDRTEIRAPADGPVSNLTVRVGNMAVEHQPMLTIVDAHAWRIQANYKERFLHHLHRQMRAWVWLDAYPGHFYRGHIVGVSHVISRQEGQPELVPYVSPTLDWIRLARRIPVRIELDDPPENIHLYMGSDARTVVFY